MESRTANLVLRLLQRHLPVPYPAPAPLKHLPGLLPRVPLSFHGPAKAGKQRLLDSSAAVARNQQGRFSDGVERTSFGAFFKQPNSPFLSSFEKVEEAGSALPEPASAWGFLLGLRLKSGMYMPTHHEEEEAEGWEASSVKRKRKKKMNKHKQRKLRRRDRHRN